MVQALHAAGVQVVAVSRTRADLDSLVREVGADSSQPSRQRAGPGVGRDARRQVLGLTKGPQQTLEGARTPWAPEWPTERRHPWARKEEEMAVLHARARGAQAQGGNGLSGGGARLLVLKPCIA